MDLLPQELASLPNEIILIIFEFIPLITDKRQFLRTCKRFNTITKKSFHIYENNYKIKNFNKINNYCMEKFTLELCHDKYFDMIPNYYITEQNGILIKALASFNCIELLELAQNRGCYIGDVGNYGIQNGHNEVLYWARCNGCFRWVSSYNKQIDLSIESGNLEGLKLIRACGINWSDHKYIKSIENGDLHILKWAMETGSKLKIGISEKAAFYGQLEILIWAEKNGCYCNSKICIAAASTGQINILVWAKRRGFKLGIKTYKAALENKQIKCLKWLKENGCDFE